MRKDCRLVGLVRAALASTLSPARCEACNALGRAPLCSACEAPGPRLVHLKYGQLDAWAAVPYVEPYRSVVRRFKYSDRPDLARPLSLWICHALGDDHVQCSFVPVPLHNRRLAERGYNQAALLARELARLQGSAWYPSLLRRSKDTPQQARLNAAQRRKNLARAFVLDAAQHPHEPVMLVDDVVTTGTTAQACAQILTDAGVAVRGLLSVAFAGACARI